MTDLPQYRPRDQIVAEAQSDLNWALLRFEKRHRLDAVAALSMLAAEIGYRARLIRRDATPHETFTRPGLTGVHEAICVEHRQIVERCRTGELAHDVERERSAKAGHDPQFAPVAALTDYELLHVLVVGAGTIANSMLRIERGADDPITVDDEDDQAPEERTLTCST